MQLAQLQGDALAQIARTDAGGFERLHGCQHAFHVGGRGFDLRQQTQTDILQIVLQIPVIRDGIGDDARDREVNRRQFGEFQLFDELFLQRLTVLVAEIPAAVVIARPR